MRSHSNGPVPLHHPNVHMNEDRALKTSTSLKKKQQKTIVANLVLVYFMVTAAFSFCALDYSFSSGPMFNHNIWWLEEGSWSPTSTITEGLKVKVHDCVLSRK